MKDQNKKKDHLISELEALRGRLALLEAKDPRAELEQCKRAEEALRQSEEKYRTLVETSPDAVILADLAGHVTFASQRSAALHGAGSVDELLGRNPLDFIVPEDRQRLAADLQRILVEGTLRNMEYGFLRTDGTRYFGEISATVVRDVAGKPLALTAIVRDVTERKKIQTALEKEHHTLRHLLQASDHERQLIAYEIHDGLAQQLAGAIMQFQVFRHLRETQPEDAAKAFDAGMTMLQQSHAEARRLISGVRPPVLDEAGILTAIAHLVNQHRQKGPRIQFHSRVEFDRLVSVLEDTVYRIVEEGLANACRHSKSDKVCLELAQYGDRLRVEIRDWGVGFDPQNVGDACFGLEGIRQRARLLDGRVAVEAAPGKGTRIRVELPVVLREDGP
jgi:PAS domain S-box-containing protein